MSPQLKQRRVGIAIHAIGWIVVFALPLLFADHTSPNYIQHYLRFSVTPLALFIVFYSNYFFLVERYLFVRKSTPLFIGINIILIAIVSLTAMSARHILFTDHHLPPPPEENAVQSFIGFFFRDMIPLILAVGMSVALKVTNRWTIMEKELETLEKEKMEAELKTLRGQINPHFLFNTLNNIYSLIALSPDKAQQAVLELSKLMRYVLYENTPRYVPLSREIDFCRNYVELMRLRISHDTDVRLALPSIEECNIEVAPLLFIPLIENAFKHGIGNSGKSYVHIEIAVTATHDIVCCIENSRFPKGENDKSGSGIGLDNLRKRLDILYTSRYEYHVECTEQYYRTNLTLHP